MQPLEKYVLPNRDGFGSDPFGYSALAWQKWAVTQTLAGFPVDVSRPPTSDDLKSPVLWMTQAHALAEAARVVIQSEPQISHLPDGLKGVCDSQYCAVGLMLVGYSLEICLKAMLIIRKGIEIYSAEEKQHRHHRLEELAEFIPGLSPKDKATLRVLTHFVTWAGRYPDPGSGRVERSEVIFELAERHQISAKHLFELAARVMRHSVAVVDDMAPMQYRA
jgi:hypothetical protein